MNSNCRIEDNLCIDEVLPIEFLLPGAGISGEKNTCAGVDPHVSKHHGLDIHSCALEPSYLVDAAILVRSRTIP